ncbi:MAG: hypothetical protein WCJ87_02190 [Burkholderiales bacterium]
MKAPQKFVLFVAIALSAPVPVFAAGTASLNETATSNSFINGTSGRISANARATSGVATAGAAQRIVAPVMNNRANVSTANSRYVNNGQVEANSRATGGVATAVAGQHVTM